MGHRPLWNNAFERVRNGRRLHCADPYGQVASTVPLSQEHDRLITRELDSHSDEIEWDVVGHAPRLSPATAKTLRSSTAGSSANSPRSSTAQILAMLR